MHERSRLPRRSLRLWVLAAVFPLVGMLLWPAVRADAFGDATGAARQEPDPVDGRYLPANTWVKLEPIAQERFIAMNFTDCTQTGALSNPVGRRGSSVVGCAKGILYFGGGGQSYPGNDVELFNIAANQWQQQYQPECLPACCMPMDLSCDPACFVEGGVGTTEITPLGRPYVEKAFQLIVYNPLRKKHTAALTSGTWEWDPSTGEWNLLTPDRPESKDIATKMLVYDPDLETVLYFATSGPSELNHSVFRFDYDTDTWIPNGAIPNQLSFAEIWSAYDSREHEYLVSHGSGTMWLYEAISGTWTQLGNVPDGVLDTKSLAYDSISGMFVVAEKATENNSLQLWTYEIGSDTWTQLDPAGEPPAVLTEQGNNLVFDDVWKRFYFLNVRNVGGGGRGGDREGDVETWAYRVGGPVGPGDANCDGRVSAADLPGVVAALGSSTHAHCGAIDVDHDGAIRGGDVLATADAIFTAMP